MAYDTELEQRIDGEIASWPETIPKKKMFGGIGYFLNGNMVFGIHKGELIFRVAAERGGELLKQDTIRHFQMGNRVSMAGWYLAGGEAIAGSGSIEKLLVMSRDYVLTLPPKGL